MSYIKTIWLDETRSLRLKLSPPDANGHQMIEHLEYFGEGQVGTPVNAVNLNKIEEALDTAHEAIDAHVAASAPHGGHISKDGDTMNGKLTLTAGTTGSASLNIPHGATPATPENGDIWSTTASLIARISGTTRTLIHNGNPTTLASDITQAEAEAGAATTRRWWSAQRVAQAIAALTQHLAALDSPEFVGAPKAPTASPGDSTMQIATTEFVVTNAILKTLLSAAGDIIYASAANTPTRLAKGTARQALIMNAGATAPEWAASLQSVLTAAGDILYASAANTPARLAKGTARQVLAMNSGATAPEWVASIQSILTTAGDLLYASAANTPARLAKGSARQVLAMNSGATAPEWVASIQSILTTAGDLLYASAANTPARLAKGTSGQVLRMNAPADAPEWTDTINSGTFLESTSINAGATYTKSVPIGEGYRLGIITMNFATNGARIVTETSATAATAVAISGIAGTEVVNRAVTARFGRNSINAANEPISGNQGISLEHLYINGTNLEFAWRNWDSSARPLNIRAQWEVLK